MADDISQMTDDELDKAIEGEEVVNDESQDEPNESQPEETAPEQQEETEQEDQAEVEQEAEEEAQPTPSRRETLRVQQLLKKYGTPEQQQQQAAQQPQQGIDYRQMIDADEEVYKQLEAQSQQYGQTQYQEGLKRAEFFDWKTSLKIEAPQVESKYSFLNPQDQENFHPAVASSLNEWYLSMSGFDPNTQTVQNSQVGYADFVEGVMELAEEIANAKVSRTKNNIAKQAATTGLRPDGSQAKRLNLNKAPEDMTDEELDAVLANLKK